MLKKTGKELDDVERRQFLGGDTLMRNRAVDKFLEVLDRRFALENGLTHTAQPVSTTTAGDCKARSDEFSRISARIIQ